MKQAFIFGAGNHGRVVLDNFRAAWPGRPVHFLDETRELWGTAINDCPVLGGWDYLRAQPADAVEVVLAIGDNYTRMRLARLLAQHRIPAFNVIHPSAIIQPTAELGLGLTICAAAIINTDARVEDHCVINTAAIVEHDAVICAYASVAPGAIVGCHVLVDNGAFIATGAKVLAGLEVGQGAIVGAGAVVTHNIAPGMLAYGVPAQEVRRLEDPFLLDPTPRTAAAAPPSLNARPTRR